MGTTSNYSWPYPEATGLVKDGWEDIKDLATAIDTTAASTFGGGISKVSTTSFSAVSSQSFNSVFTAGFNYKIILNYVVSNNDEGAAFRFRVSGSDNTTTNYVCRVGRVLSGGIAANDTIARNNFSSGAIQTASTGRAFTIIDISNPNAAEVHPIFAITSSDYGSYFGSGYFQSATAFDGFTIYPGSGTITGKATIYKWAA